MQNQQNETQALPFDGIKRLAETTIFESVAARESFKVDGKIPEDVTKAHTLKIEFDFTGITIDEVVKQLVSTTSFMKLFQNNVIGNTKDRWDEKKILDTVSKGTYSIKCRDLLDNKRKHESDPMSAIVRQARKAKDKGISNEQILEQLTKMLNQ
jgi:hypothetical protein